MKPPGERIRPKFHDGQWTWTFIDGKGVESEGTDSYGSLGETVVAARRAYPDARILRPSGARAGLSRDEKAWITTGIVSLMVSIVTILFFMKD